MGDELWLGTVRKSSQETGSFRKILRAPFSAARRGDQKTENPDRSFVSIAPFGGTEHRELGVPADRSDLRTQ
jgi:hypothetical protein